MKKVLGGERLGTGAKIKIDMHGWGRSTFNQNRAWRSTMGVGTLVPCFMEIGTNGTTFDIDIRTLGHTIPTIAPCFGEYKLQVDLFACPFRLYQGLLHNNAVNIGLEMNKVLMPYITLGKPLDNEIRKTNPSSLNNYLGVRAFNRNEDGEKLINFWGMPYLAYYDIFKNYYSNKQEENAKVIGRNYVENKANIFKSIVLESKGVKYELNYQIDGDTTSYFEIIDITKEGGETIEVTGGTIYTIKAESNWDKIKNLILETANYIFVQGDKKSATKWELINQNTTEVIGEIVKRNNELIIGLFKTPYYTYGEMSKIQFTNESTGIEILDFPLENIDKARREILKLSDKGERLLLNSKCDFLPYNTNYEKELVEPAQKEMVGLCLKTYMSDIFNNWLSNDNVELINNLSSIAIEGDEPILSMDALILAKKVYNILNRIAVNGGTYEDWQESVYGEKTIRKAESPIYIGGTSAMITFEEVVSTAETGNDPLGTLGGRGVMINRKGGNIVYKCEEPTIIMGIASITPIIDYHQGNKWYMTELDNLDNLHKPGLDGIGFQNLIANQVVGTDSTNKSLAKQPAWINYQTSINEVYGYFALDEDDEKYLGYMTLRRDYETNEKGEITDFTTYIDPEKYNKVFAGNQLTDQNFWIQIGFKVDSRRKMGAYEIPNL